MSHTELIRECGALPKPTKAQCRCEHNWGLVRFLKALAQQESGKGKDQWCMVLRRAAKGLAAHEARVTSSERAIKEVLNVGRSVGGLLDSYWAVLPPPADAAAADAAAAPAKGTKRKASAGAGAAGAKKAKRWVPKLGTANWALLVTLDRLARQGRATVTKAELVDEAEASQLSRLGIKPRGASNSAAAAAGAGGAPSYDGWSGFNSYLARAPTGHSAPLVFTYGNPMARHPSQCPSPPSDSCAQNIRLSEEGAAFALQLHRQAETRGECRCGLVAPLDDDEEPLAAAASPSPAPPAAKRAAAGSAAAAQPRREEEDVICLEDEEDEPIAMTRQRPAAATPAERRVAAPPPAPAPAPARVGPAAAAAAAAAHRALTGDAAPGAGLPWRPVPAWRLSSLSDDAEHDVRLPPLPPGVAFGTEFDIVLLVDNREQFAHSVAGGRAACLAEGISRLTQRGVRVEARGLPIGDALWAARLRRAPHTEYCLDLVVERKRVDDLESSIRDSRYKKQKYFLKRCGLRRPIYLLEGDPASGTAGASGAGLDWRTKAVKTAMLTTEVVDGFQVLRTADAGGTFDLYGRLTTALRELYTTRTGRSAGWSAPRGAGSTEAAAAPDCPTYEAFVAAVAAAKHENKTVRALWGHMLTHIPGVGGEVAEAVLWEYPTPSSLVRGFEAAGSREAARALLAPLKTTAVKTVGPVLAARIHAWTVMGT